MSLITADIACPVDAPTVVPVDTPTEAPAKARRDRLSWSEYFR